MLLSSHSLNILVVGGGLGGLGGLVAGFDSVTEFSEAGLSLVQSVSYPFFPHEEAYPSHQVGAGIRIPPNSSRLLIRWGVDVERIKKSTASRPGTTILTTASSIPAEKLLADPDLAPLIRQPCSTSWSRRHGAGPTR